MFQAAFPRHRGKKQNKNKIFKCFRLPVPGARNGTRTYPGLCIGRLVHIRHAQCWTSYCKGEKGGDNVDDDGDDVDDDVGDDDGDDVGDDDVDEDVNGLTSSSTLDLHSVARVRRVD